MSNPNTIGHNINPALDEAKAKISTLGKAEGLGSGARRDAGIMLTDYAFDGVLGESDAEEFYDRYMVARGAVTSRKKLSAAEQSAGSRNVQVSKFRSFLKLGLLPDIDGRDTLGNAVRVMADLASSEVKLKPDFDALTDVCRGQLAQPDALLTDEEIAAIVSKATPVEKDLLAKLVGLYKTAYKINAEAKMGETQAVVDSIADSIRAIDEDAVPAMTKAEKEELAFQTMCAMRGISARPATV